MHLRCSSCREEKDEVEFRKNRTTATGLHNQCKPCDSEAHAKYYRNNKRKIVNVTLLRKYGIDIDTFEAMRWLQDNRCALCGLPEVATTKGVVRELAVDHDHETGLVRGLLCFKCNTAMGRVADTPKALETLMNYLSIEPLQESCQ